ncbi:MAG: hypothetical protein GF409_06315 [Candidatus Omnitrophica bacterium]|nr:hypothetical protein [Candidatus Omnitrophota bacterium]
MINKKVTILSIGEKKDFDSYRKFHSQRDMIRQRGFVYRSIDFDRLFGDQAPQIKNDKVIVFIFFPFKYWEENIEHQRYRGIYGNLTFYNKFRKYGKAVRKRLEKVISAREVVFVNDPEKVSYYRDKHTMKKELSRKGVNVPREVEPRDAGSIERRLDKGEKFFIKPRCGSMGKGITYLEKGNWQTNFEVSEDRIKSLRSDYGWVFRDVTRNRGFLKQLLKKDVVVEEAIDPLKIKGRIVDFRVYAFFDKVLYIYPRKGKAGSVTTNISQGAKGSPRLRSTLSDKTVGKIKEQVISAMDALQLKFVGVDIMLNRDKSEAFVIDVNMFPGLPKVGTFNISNHMADELSRISVR